MRTPGRLLLLLPVVALISAAPGAIAQQGSPPPTSVGWSSRIVDTDELTRPSTTVASRSGAAGRASTTTTRVTGKAKAKAATTSAPPASDPTSAGRSAPSDGSVPADVWLALRKCESGNRYDLNTDNGFYGAYQFSPSTWKKLGYSGMPHEAAPEVQDEAARKLQAKSGWGAWPACSRRIGVR